MNIKRRPITAAQDNNYKDDGGYAEYTDVTEELYNKIVDAYNLSCRVLDKYSGPCLELAAAVDAMLDLFPRYGLDEDASAQYEGDVEGATKITAGRRDSDIAVNNAREVYTDLCDTYFKATNGVNAPFSPDGAPMYYLTKSIEAIDDIYAFGLSDEDREEMSEDIEGACGKKAVKSSYDLSAKYKDVGGGFGNVGAVYTVQELSDYWDAEYKNDPVLQEYASKDEWLKDTIQNFMTPVKGACGKKAVKSADDFDEDEYVEPENEGAVSLAYDGEYMRSFGPSLLQELIEARLSGPVNVYSVEIGNNLTTVYFEIEDMDDYSIEEAEYDIERAVDDIVNYGEEAEDGSSLDDAMYIDMGYNQYS